MVWITLTAVAAAPGPALTDVAERSTALIALLDELQVSESDRGTAGLSVTEEFEHTPRGRHSLGHRASATVTVRHVDSDVLGRAISRSSEELGASIDGPRWHVSPGNPARLEAATKAAAAAKQKAEAYADGIGARLGAVISLIEPDAVAGPRRLAPRMSAVASAAGAPHMPIEAEENEVTATIEATFALELAP